jgi:hypothetical protein
MERNHSNGSPLWGGPLSFIDDADAGRSQWPTKQTGVFLSL